MNKEERMDQDYLGVEPIEFYHPEDPNGDYSNFSEHEILATNPWTDEVTEYRTGEYRFQAMKAVTDEEHNFVIEAVDSGDAKRRGRSIQLRDGWGDSYGDLCWYVMFETILLKAIQHDDVCWTLLDTTAAIWEDSPSDDIWGIRYRNDYSGKNLLGRCWMDVRDLLQG